MKYYFLFVCLLCTACDVLDDTSPSSQQVEVPWWKLSSPDVVIDDDWYYTHHCSIYKRDINLDDEPPIELFSAPYRFATNCQSSKLTRKNEYFVISMCRVAFSAGGCGDERYRSQDFENWQEYIGITWKNNEKYDAWRNVGSTSEKADAIEKSEEE